MYALIEKESNKILKINSEYTNLSEVKPFYWIKCPENCNENWIYNNKSFIEPPSELVIPFIPSIVSMAQARQALLQQGLLQTVNIAVASGSEADQIKWEYATEVNRSDALVQNLTKGLGLSETDLDNLFLLASSL